MPETPRNGSVDDLPDWYAPPQMIGGHVTGPLLVAQSPGLVVFVRQISAYPVGVEIEVEAHARGLVPTGSPSDPAEFLSHPPLRFRIRFADGTEAVQDDETGLRSGQGPTLVLSKAESSSGGPEGRESVRLSLWMWPLPPPEPLTLICSWPHRGLVGAELSLDGDEIAAAAGRARPFWPQSS